MCRTKSSMVAALVFLLGCPAGRAVDGGPDDLGQPEADAVEAGDADGGDVPEAPWRCSRSDQCAAAEVCSDGSCVPTGFGFVGEYLGAGGPPPAPSGIACEWPVTNGDERRGRRSTVAGDLSRPVGAWRFDAGQALAATQIAIVDVDGDGQSDVVTAEGGRLRARRQDNTTIWATSSLGEGLSIASVADLDGDGAPEIALAASPPRVVVLSARTGAIAGDVNDIPSGYVQVHVVPDLSGDGVPEVFTVAKNIAVPQNLTLRAYRLAATGLQMLWEYREGNGYYGSPTVVAGDVDGDGAVDLTLREYWNSWFKSFSRTGGAIASSAGPTRSAGAMYLRDVDGNSATTEVVHLMDRGTVDTDAHEAAAYRLVAGSWVNVWRRWDVDAPPAHPVLSAPWAGAVQDFDGAGGPEAVLGLHDWDATAGRSHWSTVLVEVAGGTTLASEPDVVPLAVVRPDPALSPAILTISSPSDVVPPLGTVTFSRWTGSVFRSVWTRDDATPAILRARQDVLGTTGVNQVYETHGGLADLEGDGVAEVLLFTREFGYEFADRPNVLVAVSSTDGTTRASYLLPDEDRAEVVAVEGSGPTLRVWISSHQLGILALDDAFRLVLRLEGWGFSPTARVVATAVAATAAPAVLVTDSSEITHVLEVDPASADMVERGRLNHRMSVLSAMSGPAGRARVLVEDRNADGNDAALLDEQVDGTFLAAWTVALDPAEDVQMASRGSFGAARVPAFLLQIRNTLDAPASRYLALSEADGSLLWTRAMVPPPRPYVRGSLLASALVTCRGGDQLLSCTQSCACAVWSGQDGSQLGSFGTGGCDALAVAAGRTDAVAGTRVAIGGGAYATALATVGADCSVGGLRMLPDDIQSVPALLDATSDTVLDVAYWSSSACMHVVDGATGATLWSRTFFGGAAVACNPATPEARLMPTPAATGDVDNDGGEDLVLGTPDGDLIVAAGATGGILTRVAIGRTAREPVLGDVDGDGLPEILVGTEDGYLYVFDQR